MKKSTPKKKTSGKSKVDKTDWKRLDAMKDEDIDFSDIPEVTPEMFAKAIVRKNLKPVRTKSR
jgi:hypothetical protein